MAKPALKAKVERQRDPKLFVKDDWEELGEALSNAIRHDLAHAVKPSTGRQMPRYRDPERSGVAPGTRVRLYKTGALYRSFQVSAHDGGVRVSAGDSRAFYAWILDRRFRFMTVPQDFGPTAVDTLEAALGHNLATRKVRVKRKRKRKTKKESYDAAVRRFMRSGG